VKWGTTAAGLVLFFAMLACAISGDNYLIRMATTFAMYSTLALSWNLIGGFTGYPSFATAAFFGLGAYASGVMELHGFSLLSGVVVAGFVAGFFALALGALVLHLRGHYFAIATLVVADVVREFANNAESLTGGGMGLNVPLRHGSPHSQALFYLLAMSLCAIVAIFAAKGVFKSRLGFGLRCIAQNEAAAASIGVNARAYKTAAFALSGVFPALAGAVYASWVTYIDPTDVFDVLLTIKPIVMVLIGGSSIWFGPIVGAFVFIVLEEFVWRHLLNFHTGSLGILIALLIVFLPGGLRSLIHPHNVFQRLRRARP